MSPRGHCNLGNPLDVVGIRGDDYVNVLGATHNTPGVQGEAAHHHEFDIRLCQALQQLVKGRLVQFFCAAPVNRISL